MRSFRTNNRSHTYRSKTKIMGIGAADGLGSLIYGLVKISNLLDDEAILKDAAKAASLISLNLIKADHYFDILGGSAGTILGLLTYNRSCYKWQILEKAAQCGTHLVENWAINEKDPAKTRTLTGFSHGAAGIACALLCLYELTSKSEFLLTAKKALAYEQGVFCAEKGNWPDLRQVETDNELVCMSKWCHGAPGIGLARIGGLPVLNDESIQKDIEVSLETTLKTDLHIPDHLCCGNLGLVDILLTAGGKLSRPDLQREALQRASWVIAKKKRRGNTATIGLKPCLFLAYSRAAQVLVMSFCALLIRMCFPRFSCLNKCRIYFSCKH